MFCWEGRLERESFQLFDCVRCLNLGEFGEYSPCVLCGGFNHFGCGGFVDCS